MGNQTLKEVKIHVLRIENAFNELEQDFSFPIEVEDFQ